MLNKPENLHPSAIRAKQDDINITVYPIKNKNNHILVPVHPSILKRSQKIAKLMFLNLHGLFLLCVCFPENPLHA